MVFITDNMFISDNLIYIPLFTGAGRTGVPFLQSEFSSQPWRTGTWRGLGD